MGHWFIKILAYGAHGGDRFNVDYDAYRSPSARISAAGLLHARNHVRISLARSLRYGSMSRETAPRAPSARSARSRNISQYYSRRVQARWAWPVRGDYVRIINLVSFPPFYLNSVLWAIWRRVFGNRSIHKSKYTHCRPRVSVHLNLLISQMYFGMLRNRLFFVKCSINFIFCTFLKLMQRLLQWKTLKTTWRKLP